jgi:PAS domain-containing protein
MKSMRETFLIVLDNDLRIVGCNDSFADAVGFDKIENQNALLRNFVSHRDRGKLDAWLRQTFDGEAAPSLIFKFLANDQRHISVEALCLADRSSGSSRYVVSARQETISDLKTVSLLNEVEFLREVIDQSSEAMWCIEFYEVVDLDEDEDEVVRQIFENKCSLRLCNKAMRRLYDVPDDANIDELPVSRNFPRSRANERYIRGLIPERFNVDSALSIDIKHNGQAIYGDNSVRSDIEDNNLLRFWGTMRDVTSYRQIQAKMSRQHRSLKSILAAIPEAVLVIGKDRRLKGANPAFETLLDQSLDSVLDQKVDNFFDFGDRFPELESLGAGSLIRCDVVSCHKSMAPREFVAWVAPMAGVGADSSLIITLRSSDSMVQVDGTTNSTARASLA